MSLSTNALRFDHRDILWSLVFFTSAVCLPFAASAGSREPLYAFLFLCCFLSLFHFLFKSGTRTLPNHTLLLTLVFFIGLGIRLFYAFYYPPGPALYRSIWDGLLQLNGINPCVYSPNHPDLAQLTAGPLAEFYSKISFPENTACSGPLSLLLWYAAAWFSPTTFGFKLIFVICDCIVFGLLTQVLLKRRLPAIWSVLYWLNPLVMVSVAGQGCFTILAPLFLCLGVFAFLSQRDWAGYLSFGLAGTVLFPLLFLGAFFLSKKNWKFLILLFLPAIAAIPFFGAPSLNLNAFWEFSPLQTGYFSLFSLLQHYPYGFSVTLVTVLAALCLVGCFLLLPDRMHALFAATGCLLLLLPGVPCSLCLMALFMPLFPSRGWLFLLATLPLTVFISEQLAFAGMVRGDLWAASLPYAPFFLLLLWGIWFGRDRLAHSRCYNAPQSLCVLIPTRDDAVHLVQCVENVRRVAAYNELPVEIILADAGSTDGTLEQARELGVRVQSTGPGRSRQIRETLPHIREDVVLLLPVDCLLENDALPRMLTALAQNSHAMGGALGMRFAYSDPGLCLVSLCNTLRARIFGLSLSNQGQFFRRCALPSVGGFPDLEILEDLELALRLQQCAPALYIGKGVRASRRIWSEQGLITRSAQSLRLVCGYLWAKKWRTR